MRVTLALTAWVVSVVSSYCDSTNSLPDIDNEAFIKDCVHIHNKFRSEVKPRASDMLYMVSELSASVAEVSRKQQMHTDLGGKAVVALNDLFHCDLCAQQIYHLCWKQTCVPL